MQVESTFLTKKNLMVATIFFILNLSCIFLIFNNNFFNTIDRHILNIQFIFFVIGLSFILFFISLKILNDLSIKNLFILFIITRILILLYLSLFNYGVDLDLQETWLKMVYHIIHGDLFTPYSVNFSLDFWRMNPPVLMWWYTYNFYLYGLNPIGWRIVNFLLELGIFYLVIQIFRELKILKENVNEEHFKIGLLFYTFSIFPILTFLLYIPAIAFPILLAQCGIYYYIKSKTTPKYLYHSLFFLTLCALTVYQAAIWIFVIICLLILQHDYKRIKIAVIEVIAIFCLVSSPMLINDPLGYLYRLIIVPQWETSIPNATYWLFDQVFLKLILLFFSYIVLYLYLSEKYQEMKTLDFFTISLSIALLFAPVLYPWTYLWILPVISINLIYSFKNYLKINLIFYFYVFLYYLLFAILFLLYPNPANPNYYTTFIQILSYGDAIGFFQLFQVFLVPIFQFGLIYVIYVFTKSKILTFTLLFPCVTFIINNFLIWLGSLLY
jgi:hypothetical protein